MNRQSTNATRFTSQSRRSKCARDLLLYGFSFEKTGSHVSFMTILRLLARQTRLPGATDNTRYGEGRASPRSFLTHHVANISTAIQAADAQTILNAAGARMLRVSYGVM
jgi:hypothetical protein